MTVFAPHRDRAVERRDRRCRLADRVVPHVDQESDVLEQERDGKGRHEHHGGRLGPERTEDEAIHQRREHHDDDEAHRDACPRRPVGLRRERERVGAGHHDLPVGEVDEPQHPEDQADPDGHQRVDGAEADCVDDRLRVERRDESAAHER